MSGFEIAGIVLGAFPLIIQGIGYYHSIVEVAGHYKHVRQEYQRCQRDLNAHHLEYKYNLRNLLSPIISKAETERLIENPNGQSWKEKHLQSLLERRLCGSYDIYMDITEELNETVEKLKKELCLDNPAIQSRLGSKTTPQSDTSSFQAWVSSARSTLEYKTFRLKFSINEPVRNGLISHIGKCIKRLGKLQFISNETPMSQTTGRLMIKQSLDLEDLFAEARKKSDQLFKAFKKAWHCPCEVFHFAHLRLEHRTAPDICFDVALSFSDSPATHHDTPWTWIVFQCKETTDFPTAPSLVKPGSIASPSTHLQHPDSSALSPKISNAPSNGLPTPNSLRLCQLLGSMGQDQSLATISHDNQAYALQCHTKRTPTKLDDTLTLKEILCHGFEHPISRRQRYHLALLVASSVAQLRLTAWLKGSLSKDDIFFMICEDVENVSYREPFIRQGFGSPRANSSQNTDRFLSLGILLLELCFGQRLEDHDFYRKGLVVFGDKKEAFQRMVALTWAREVSDEAGPGWSAAVKWCLEGAYDRDQTWETEIIKNVIRPLEACQGHFKAIEAC